jgi:hypothetical protein
MPYLDLANEEDLTHLLQLYAAATPTYRAKMAEMRDVSGLDQQYFLNAQSAADLCAWARQRNLVRGKQAAVFVAGWRQFEAEHRPLETVMTLRTAVLGIPPRAQPVVWASEIYQWLFATSPGPIEEEYVLTLETARMIVEGEISKGAGTTTETRARRLLAWLDAQPPQHAD